MKNSILRLLLTLVAISTVHVIGELAGALGFPRPKLYARFEILSDAGHWHVMQGTEAGYTQVDETSVRGCVILVEYLSIILRKTQRIACGTWRDMSFCR